MRGRVARQRDSLSAQIGHHCDPGRSLGDDAIETLGDGEENADVGRACNEELCLSVGRGMRATVGEVSHAAVDDSKSGALTAVVSHVHRAAF